MNDFDFECDTKQAYCATCRGVVSLDGGACVECMTDRDLRALKLEGRRDRGQCLLCDLQAVDGRTLCSHHAASTAARIADVRLRKIALGTCRQCTKPAAPGRRACDAHLAIARDQKRKEAP